MHPATTPLLSFTRRLERFAPLEPGDRAAILTLPAQEERIGRGRRLVEEGQDDHPCLFLLSGFAQRHGILADGQRQITGLYVPGDIIGLRSEALPRAHQTVGALGPVELLKIPHKALTGLADAHPAIARALWNETLADAAAAQDWIITLGKRDARGRVLALLGELMDRCRRAGLAMRDSIVLPLTQEEIGDATGLTSVHVNRTLMALQAEGVIERAGRRVTLLRPQTAPRPALRVAIG